MTDAPTEREGEGAWTKLRRRKVVQWGIAYAAGAWGFLQGLQFLAEAFEWPTLALRLATVAFALGLPIAVVVAWYHGDRGHQRVTRTELVILTLLFLVGGGLFWRYQHTIDTASVATPPTSIAPAALVVDQQSIAVLPFVNMSSDPEQVYFSDGLAEQILDLLSGIPDLRVIARTSSFSFRGKDTDVTTIAQQLRVSHVLEGSVRKSGSRLRVTAQLIKAEDSSQLWSETFDRELTEIFAIQDEIATAVVQQLKLTLLGGALPARRTTQSTDAYESYLKGVYLDGRRAEGDLEAALAYYERALAIDPGFAAASTGVARMYTRLALQTKAERDWQKARDAANRALELEPGNAEAHAALAWILAYHDWNWADAQASIDRALELGPGNARTVGTAGTIYAFVVGDYDRGLSLMRRAVTLDPYRLASHNNLAWTLMFGGRLQESWASFETAQTLSVDPTWVEYPFGLLLLARGEPGAALERMQKVAGINGIAGRVVAYHALGQSERSNEELQKLNAAAGDADLVLLAQVQAFRGEKDEALGLLDRAYRNRDSDLTEIRLHHPLMKNLEAEPRYQEFLRTKMKFPGL